VLGRSTFRCSAQAGARSLTQRFVFALIKLSAHTCSTEQQFCLNVNNHAVRPFDAGCWKRLVDAEQLLSRRGAESVVVLDSSRISTFTHAFLPVGASKHDRGLEFQHCCFLG
jgi:hypothetical protein